MNLFFYSRSLRLDRRDLWLAVLAMVATIAFIPVFTYFYFARDLTTKESIMNRNDTGLVLLDKKDRPFFTLYQAKQKEFVPLSDIPPQTQQAIIAIEDKDFYNHPGFSVRGIARSFLADVFHRKVLYGGSTITQQLVKNALLTPQRSLLRKYQEIVLAQEIERRYSKNEILEMYLNSVYFGEGAFGIQEAAHRYFNTDAKNLTLTQSTILAGILPSPSEFSPVSGDISKAKERQSLVLQAMTDQGYITQEQAHKAAQEKIVFTPQKDNLNSVAAHFALMVRDELIKKYGEEQVSRSGFKVKTTLDLDLQKYAEKVVAQQVEDLKFNRVTNGAAVIIDPKSGEIRALVGSKDWYDEKFGKVNIATSLRQPGSSFKPIVYTAAMEKRIITPATPLKDDPITYRAPGLNYSPKDYDGKYRGTVLVRRALANSLNIPSVEVMYKLGVPSAVDFAKRLGITTLEDPSHYGLSLVLGAGEVKLLELTNAYAVFASGGLKNSPTTIMQITNKQNNTIYMHNPEEERVLEPEFAFLISSILSDNKARAEEFGNALTISRPAAVKTGTTEDYRDAWTIGYTPSVVVGVWVGNNDGALMDNIAGSLGAAPIWRQLMEHYLAGSPVENFQPPAGVVTKNICSYNGLLIKDATSSATQEYFLRGTEPTQYCYAPQAPTPSVSPSASPQPTNAVTSTPAPSQAAPTPTAILNQPINLPPGQSKKEK